MPDTLTTVQAQLYEAVFNTRVARHHQDCHCGQYRDTHGAPYCTPAEWRYDQMVNRLIDKAEREQETVVTR